MRRRTFLISIGSLSIAGCAETILIGTASYYYREPLAQYYCNLLGCEDGEVSESELRVHVMEKTKHAAELAVQKGMEVSDEDILAQYEQEMLLARKALRNVGVKLTD
ncbi:hypothetical protein [Pseudoalteromonas luteoviolacea]|uniref:hypothetical protein n=1 Tax=Pseudoalteromonas luteoviolacea TaxID=43657 RepID=UPI001B36889F|nr:hypothetical protein [Pseudoalteromonas luteoviolacea]MBQ4836875.1 hypothetical protein [Pseudoalteromonas luteoviolacea]